MWICGCGELIQWEIISISMVLFPFQFPWYIQHHSHSHENPSRSHSYPHLYCSETMIHTRCKIKLLNAKQIE